MDLLIFFILGIKIQIKPKELERKFLIRGDFKGFYIKNYAIVQGFSSTVPERTVCVRIQDNKGYLTIKGKGNVSGTTFFEWEKKFLKLNPKDY